MLEAGAAKNLWNILRSDAWVLMDGAGVSLDYVLVTFAISLSQSGQARR